jgi:Ribbon-helix-helix domain
MQDTTGTAIHPTAVEAPQPPPSIELDGDKADVVSTHVLVDQEQVDKLRELSKRTRIAQSEYLREAVDDLLLKYQKKSDAR